MRTPWLLVLSPALVSAYTWQFTNTPAQCQNVTIAISGAGSPPYNVLIIPFGPTPLPNNIEARRIVSQDFQGNQSTVSFELEYPANSQFVAVVSNTNFIFRRSPLQLSRLSLGQRRHRLRVGGY
jgi:hypothetical protein